MLITILSLRTSEGIFYFNKTVNRGEKNKDIAIVSKQLNWLFNMNLNQVTITVKNVAQSILFYERLGLKLIVKALPHYARFECTAGDATFSLHQNEEGSFGSSTWIYFEDENLDATVNRLINEGVVFEELPTDKSWLWREAKLKDLDNNQLIIYHAGINRKDPPWKLA